MDRIQFLRELYSSIYGTTLAEKLAHAYRSSTDRQAQSCWNAFKTWLPEDARSISAKTVLDFLAHLEDDKHLNPRTILNYRSRLRQPFQLAFDIDF